MFNKEPIAPCQCRDQESCLKRGFTAHSRCGCKKISLEKLQEWGTESLQRLEDKYHSFVTPDSKRVAWIGFLGEAGKRQSS